MDPKEVVEFCKKQNVRIVDLRFLDLLGLWQHFSIPVKALTPATFAEGLGFDGSSIRGWQSIHESDMLVVPDPTTGFLDPFSEVKTLNLICDIRDPITGRDYLKDPRQIGRRAEAYLRSTGIATEAYFGPEAEFFIFDDIRYDQSINQAFYHIDSAEGHWNTGREESPNLGYKPRHKEGYFPVPPTDSLQDIRNEMILLMEECGLEVEAQHHEVATAGQSEIDLRYRSLVKQGDGLMIYKYITKNVARRRGKTVTFMPKPLFDDNGSGMHIHFSLWNGDTPLFAGDKYAGISQTALYAIGGILKHTPALTAFTNPTTNSYKRLVPGFEAPVNLAYSSRNRSAAIRIPMYSNDPGAKRLEFRCPDPACNPYLAFAAIMMAGLDGIQNKIDPGPPLDEDIYALPDEAMRSVPSTPVSLDAALDALEKDNEFLRAGDVFSKDVLSTWISYKRQNEVEALRLRPHPYEFLLYYDI
ncbi:MAG: type I glutamate--ammonia ligase [Planctomycetota bacterium]|nr:type I glutamate--ammonia ligase [Planctomycetota bacterium]